MERKNLYQSNRKISLDGTLNECDLSKRSTGPLTNFEYPLATLKKQMSQEKLEDMMLNSSARKSKLDLLQVNSIKTILNNSREHLKGMERKHTPNSRKDY